MVGIRDELFGLGQVGELDRRSLVVAPGGLGRRGADVGVTADDGKVAV